MASSRQSGSVRTQGSARTSGRALAGAKAIPAHVSMEMSLAWSPTQATLACGMCSSSAIRRTMPPLLAPLAVSSTSDSLLATIS